MCWADTKVHGEPRTPADGPELHAAPCTWHTLLLVLRVIFPFRELGSTYSKPGAATHDKTCTSTFAAPDLEVTSADSRLSRGAADDGFAVRRSRGLPLSASITCLMKVH